MDTNNEGREVRDYADEIGVHSVPISIAKEVVQLCWHDGHVPLLIGESATGKTASLNQLAKVNEMELIPFHLGNVDSSNIRGPAFPQPDGTFKYLPPGHIPIEWAPSTRQKRILHRLKDYSLELSDILEEDFDTAQLRDKGFSAKDLDTIFEIREGVAKEFRKAGLFFDELNRGDKDGMNAVMPVWTEHLLGAVKLGRNVRVAAAMNPPGGKYAVNSQISSDPAMRRRVCQIVVHFSHSELLRYAEDPARAVQASRVPALDYDELGQREEARPWHSAVVGYVRQTPGTALDTKSREAGKIYACPSTWEAVSDTLYTIERLELDLDDPVIHRVVKTKLSGHLNASVALDFLDYYQKEVDVIDPVEVLYHYTPKTSIWNKVQKKLGEKEHLGLMKVLEASIEYLFDPADPDNFEIRDVVPQLGHLINDLPTNCAQDLLTYVAQASKEAEGSVSKTVRELMHALMDDENFDKFQVRTLEMSTKQAEEEAAEAAQSDDAASSNAT